jgi:hypothetical protein
MQIMINWSHVCIPGNCSGPLMVTPSVAALAPAATGADTYVEFTLASSHSTIGPGESADFAFQMQGPNPGTDVYTQNNDYSFDSSKTTAAPWDHAVLLQNGIVIWGTLP